MNQRRFLNFFRPADVSVSPQLLVLGSETPHAASNFLIADPSFPQLARQERHAARREAGGGMGGVRISAGESQKLGGFPFKLALMG